MRRVFEPRWLDPVSHVCLELHADGKEKIFRLVHPQGFSTEISEDGEIERTKTDVSGAAIKNFIREQVTPRALSQSGRLVLHAGAVAISDEDCFLVLGETGQGKSTLCASFHAAGNHLLGDDATMIVRHGKNYHAQAVTPTLRLFPDSLEHLDVASLEPEPEQRASGKRSFEIKNSAKTGLASPIIRAGFSIQKSERAITIERLTPRAACMTILANSFALDPTDREKAAIRLRQASELVQRIPVFALSFPHDYSQLEFVRLTILDRIRQIES